MTQFLATRTQVAVLAVAAVAALGVVGAIGWVTWSAQAAARVSASWELDCPGTRLGDHEGEPAIWSRPGWRCDVAVRVVNDSDRAVHLTGLTGRKVGPAGTSEVQALDTDEAPLTSAAGATDAAWELDATVPAHESRTVTVAIGWRVEGCDEGAGYVGYQPWATVRFQTLRRDHEVTSPQALVLRTFRDAHDEQACAAAGD